MADQQNIAHEVNQLPSETARRADENEATVRNAMEQLNCQGPCDYILAF